MSSTAWRARDIMGLTPGIDLRRSDKVYAVGGSNFAFTSKGPRSLFGNRCLVPHKLGNPEHVQGARIRIRGGDRVFTFESQAILEWDEDIGGWVILYITPDTTLGPYRWTWGYLNDKIFFCHPRTGIIVYDLSTGRVYKHDGPGVPPYPLAICVNNGRLCVIDDIYFYWSWQSDGLNFTPAIGQAGFQKIADRVGGFPIMINTYARGVLIWTTGGLMRSEFTGDQEVYRHRNLNTEYRPINSFCTLQTNENTIVILDERGLFSSSGDIPEPFAPLFNEFLIEYIRKNRLTIGQNVRIEWDDLRRLMYVSVSLSEASPLYERAYVLYPPLDKWGVFSESHFGILPVGISGSTREGQYYGFVDDSARLRFWSDYPNREVEPAGGTLNLRYPRIQKDTHEASGGGWWIGSSSLTMNAEPQLPMLGPAGYYESNSNTPATPTVEGLGAKLQVGLIRFDELNDSYDHMTEVVSVMLGNIESGPESGLAEDYLTVPDGVADEDYEVVAGAEDFGEEPAAYINHGIRVISTIDGKNAWQDTVPQMVQFEEAVRHYACSTVGIWHILELTALNPGEAFHLQAFELNAVDAGRLS